MLGLQIYSLLMQLLLIEPWGLSLCKLHTAACKTVKTPVADAANSCLNSLTASPNHFIKVIYQVEQMMDITE